MDVRHLCDGWIYFGIANDTLSLRLLPEKPRMSLMFIIIRVCPALGLLVLDSVIIAKMLVSREGSVYLCQREPIRCV
jgi:hypothetical protein